VRPNVIAEPLHTQPAACAICEPDKGLEAAQKLFPCPDAKWHLVQQKFSHQHKVLKLTFCQWPHRPTVAVDEQGSALMLTDGVLSVSEKSTLSQFNAAAKAESLVRTEP
jgi:hypothetical protein